MKAQLKEMRLRNFKGADDVSYKLAQLTEVRGTNGTGKTTLADAFNFCLFGKDSQGRTDFGYKRRDANGVVIHDLEYAVELIFDIDGAEKIFERIVTEKWTKPRGSSDKVLSGHESSFFINRVKCTTKKEYDTEVAKIATEDVMRMLTDTTYFLSQKDEVKKSMLLKMAYGTSNGAEADKIVTDAVIAKHPDFKSFVAEINGSSLNEINRLIGGKIKYVKEELDAIPTMIAAKKETIPAEEDWDAIQALIDANTSELENIERQIADDTARQAAGAEAVNKIRAEISNVEVELLKAENAVRTKIDNYESDVKKVLNAIDVDTTSATREYNQTKEQLDKDKEKVKDLEAKLAALRQQYKSIKDGSYQFSESELMCPTCKRPYDKEKLVEQKLAENVNTGKALRVEYDRYVSEVTLLEKKAKELTEKIDDLYKKKVSVNFVPADVNKYIHDDATCQSLREMKEKLKQQLEATPATMASVELMAAKQDVKDKIEQLQRKLGTKDLIKGVEKQIEILEDKQRSMNDELAKLEYQQDMAKNFQKLKDQELLERVNSLFSVVTWDFVSEQLNGNDRIACNCYVEGMPYNECNHARQVNAGLDIINAIGRCENLNLPIFIDNAESVVEYIRTESQLIKLIVDKNENALKIYNCQ